MISFVVVDISRNSCELHESCIDEAKTLCLSVVHPSACLSVCLSIDVTTERVRVYSNCRFCYAIEVEYVHEQTGYFEIN